jgi:hypothetical protein
MNCVISHRSSLLIVIFSIVLVAQGWCQCDGVLSQGIFDEFRYKYNADLKTQVSNILKSDYTSFQSELNKADGGAEFIYGIMGGAAHFSTDEEKFNYVKSLFEQNQSAFFESAIVLQYCQKTANPSIIKAWSDCVSKQPLFAYFYGDPYGDFFVFLTYQPKTPSPQKITVTDLLVSSDISVAQPASSLHKNANVNIFNSAVAKMHRANQPVGPGAVVINTSLGPAVQVSLPSSTPTPKPPPAPVHRFATQLEVYATNEWTAQLDIPAQYDNRTLSKVRITAAGRWTGDVGSGRYYGPGGDPAAPAESGQGWAAPGLPGWCLLVGVDDNLRYFHSDPDAIEVTPPCKLKFRINDTLKLDDNAGSMTVYINEAP